MNESVITVKLQRGDGTSWGFRLAGGKDFGYPLSIQRVNPGSLAEKGGLQTGDALISIQGKSTDQLRHKEAQDAIMRAGNYLELQVTRGASMTWKPKVTPVGSMPKPGPMSNGGPAPVTKTSLAANKQPYKPIGTGHNTAAKPFGGTMQAVVHNQYNSPMPVYSMNNIADTLSAQTEVLTSGAVGINFMKGDKPLNKDSAVYRMVLEEDKHPKDYGSGGSSSPALGGPPPAAVTASSPTPAPMVNLRHVEAPKTAPAPPPGQPNTTVGAPNTCADCGRLIVGVFVRIKDRALHAECFRCATCGTSLKNIGYFNIKDKLYCDIHAKQAARHIAPGSNLEAVPVPPGGHIPQGVPLAPAPAPAPAVVPVAPRAPAGAVSPQGPLYTPPAPKYTPAAAPYTPTQAAPVHSPVAAAPLADQPPPPPDSPGICYDSPVAMGRSDFRQAPTHSPVAGSKPLTPQSAKTTPPFGGVTPLHPVTAPVGDAHRPVPGLSQGAGSRPAPKRGRGKLTQAIGGKIPICSSCGSPIRGPFVTALGRNWCPEHFLCSNGSCRKSLQDIGFVEEQGKLYCEHCYECYMAPICRKCGHRIKGDCLNALEQTWHPECFVCTYCKTAFGNSSFYLEDGMPYCEKDWNELFTTKCVGCGFPIEAGDRWVEALNNNYHSQCFKCTICQKNLEGQSFFAKGGRPFCKAHAR
ncbi:Z band alternatively spliced PDZ-motif protein 52 isoform X6 [Amblyomma americanum]